VIGRPGSLCAVAIVVAATAAATAATDAATPAGPSEASGYTVMRAAAGPDALLAADAAAWSPAAEVEWGPPRYKTTFRALWSEAGLFLRFEATDPDPWHTMSRRGEHLWEEEVVEIFLDPGRQGRDYYELEISPANVVCEVRMIAPSPNKAQDFTWGLAGLQTRAEVHRDAAGKPIGWTATARLPWPGLKPLPSAAHVALPPAPGDRWRFNLFRIERPGGPKAPEKDVVAVAWSPTGEPSFHVPRAFRDLVFAGSR
jgi:hypothetical protein